MKKIFKIIIAILFLSGLSSYLYSVDLPKVPKVGIGGGDDKNAIDVDALADQQSALVQQMSSALSNLLTAQQKFLVAFGLKKEADALQKDIDNMKEGKNTPKKAFKSATKNAVDSQVLIDEKIKLGTIDAEGKIRFAEGLPPYGVGSVNMLGAGLESIKLFKSLKGTKNLNVLRKLGNLIYLGKNSPKLISTFSTATKTISDFTSKNKIEEPAEFAEAKNADWGM